MSAHPAQLAQLASRLRRILVHVGPDETCAVRVQVAARMAATHACELIGVAPTGILQMPGGVHSAALAAGSAEQARQHHWRTAEDRLQEFHAVAKAAGAARITGLAVEGDPAAALLHHALTADLLVVGHSSAPHAGRAGLGFLEQLLLRCPRPVLVLPGHGSFHHLGTHIVIGWDGGPVAARAAADAMPLLAAAERVHVCTWHHLHDGVDLSEHLDSVAQWLRCHGVNAEPRVEPVVGPIGEALCRTATSLKADLIVMGTYGHSRWVERVVGGATRTALLRSPVPLLMSH